MNRVIETYQNNKREGFMAKGGWIVKFDNKEVERCYAVSFDYDEWYIKEVPAPIFKEILL
jgi:hypothetical protein